MASTGTIASVIKRFICEQIARGYDIAALGDEDSLLDSGILDSFGITTLLAFIQQEYGVDIPAADIEPSHFETVTAIAQTVSRYLQA
jgi:acyl carrier protein